MASVELDFSELSEFNASMLKMVEQDMPNEAKSLCSVQVMRCEGICEQPTSRKPNARQATCCEG